MRGDITAFQANLTPTELNKAELLLLAEVIAKRIESGK